eukprot:TRINITY_DN4250_c0_g1_i1.p1 TRINITY_DN4250_c0_g1~~TRINITY_DN4250_c0_g1_i1.p1  ORF type:complete len:205 (-),score=52.38 TRINITY_DN4250_c0_g1_i1:167-781(-)
MNEQQFRVAVLQSLAMKDSSLTSSLLSFSELVKLMPGTDTEKMKTLLNSIKEELDQFKLQIEKEELVINAVRSDIVDYEKMYKEKEQEILEVKRDIENLKKQLEEEKKLKHNRSEYLALLKLINQHPKRSDTSRSIDLLEKELEGTRLQSKLITQELECRSQQFQLALYALNMLQGEMSSNKRKLEESGKRHGTEPKKPRKEAM